MNILPVATSFPAKERGRYFAKISHVSIVFKARNMASMDEVGAARIPARAKPERRTGRRKNITETALLSHRFPYNSGCVIYPRVLPINHAL
ncbi:MAG: hypothetical protein NTX75_00590 [Proteobacteria bacterium]|nr:hypothetical protein [Pseudomonadota bacterium]